MSRFLTKAEALRRAAEVTRRYASLTHDLEGVAVERHRALWTAVECGATHREIADAVGLSNTRIAQILNPAQRPSESDAET